MLTSTLIKQRTKCEDLSTVRNLNLWGNDISDISIVSKMQNIEVLSLSFNQIETLRDIRTCPKLKELYIRKNNVRDLTEIKQLKACKNLRVLWFSENPCSEHKDYRLYIIRHLPSLTKLDNMEVTSQERQQAMSMSFHGIEQLSHGRSSKASKLTGSLSKIDSDSPGLDTQSNKENSGHNSVKSSYFQRSKSEMHVQSKAGPQ